MKLVVKDFGAIKKKSEIDLDKRFYVFVGYNNSGKTYMSQLMWAFYGKLLGFSNYLGRIKEIDSFFEVGKKAITLDINQQLIKYVIENYKVFLKREFNFLPFTHADISISFSERDMGRIIKKASTMYLHQFNIYGIFKEEGKSQFIAYKLKDNTQYNFHEAKDNSEKIVEEDLEKIKPILLELLLNLIMDVVFYIRNNTYIPSYRTFLPSYYKYIYSVAKEENELISKRLNTEKPDLEVIKELSSRPYSEAVDEILKRMQYLDRTNPTQYYPEFITDLQEIMQGDISFRSSEGIAPIKFGFQTESGVSLDMHDSSSSVNQLTLLYLYFKYWAEEKNNFLIVDEPEENLHPENQIKLLNLLVKFANMNNNRVLITTHSPLMAEVVNNHAHISLLKERGENIAEIIQEHGLEIAESNELKHDDYAVYFFDGEQIKNYPMNEYGAFFKDFKAAEEKVKNTADILKNYIYESSNQTVA